MTETELRQALLAGKPVPLEALEKNPEYFCGQLLQKGQLEKAWQENMCAFHLPPTEKKLPMNLILEFLKMAKL